MSPLNDDKVVLALKSGQMTTESHPVAVDAIHAKVVALAPWAPAKPVRDAFAEGPCDLVLVAVPEGMGAGVAVFLAENLLVLEDTTPVGALEGKDSEA